MLKHVFCYLFTTHKGCNCRFCYLFTDTPSLFCQPIFCRRTLRKMPKPVSHFPYRLCCISQFYRCVLYNALPMQPYICNWFLPQVNVRVTTMDAELEFAIQPSTTGKQLFDQVQQHLYRLHDDIILFITDVM